MVRTLFPSPALAPFVTRYRFRECDHVGEPQNLLSPARVTQFAEFYLADRYEVEDISRGQIFRAASSSLVGLQAVSPIRLIRSGHLRNFTVVFRPTAFHELFGLPMHEIAGKSVDLEAVCLGGLRDRIGNCQSFEGAVQEVERTLLPYAEAAQATGFTRWMRSATNSAHEGASLDQWLQSAPVGSRQVQRLFQRQIGVSPKRFWRVRRFETALRTRRDQPTRAWGEIAVDLGYHDQMHLVHDFHELAGTVPTLALARMSDSY